MAVLRTEIQLEKLKSKKTRARDQIEAEKERKESLLLHHENADFFYALDKKVQKVGSKGVTFLTVCFRLLRIWQQPCPTLFKIIIWHQNCSNQLIQARYSFHL